MRRLVFAVRKEQPRLALLKRRGPVDEPRLTRVCGEAAERVNLGSHRQMLAEDGNFLDAVDKPAAERAISLVADDDDMRRRVRQVVS